MTIQTSETPMECDGSKFSSSLQVKITSINKLAPSVKEFTLHPTQASRLPSFIAGSHVLVKVPLGGELKLKPYSLTSSPRNLHYYQIVVAMGKDSSLGGVSSFLHQYGRVGATLDISYPAAGIQLAPYATKHVFLAGGTGVTPFLSHLALLAGTEIPYEVHYTYPAVRDAIFLDWLIRNVPVSNLFTYASRETGRVDCNQVIARQPQGSNFYVSGPTSLVETVIASAWSYGLPPERLHFERSLLINDSLKVYLEGRGEFSTIIS